MVANDPPLAVQLILTSAAILLPSRAYSFVLCRHGCYSTRCSMYRSIVPFTTVVTQRTLARCFCLTSSDRSQLLFSTVSNRLSKVASDSLRSESLSKKKYILVQEELKDLASNRIASFVVQQTWTYVKKSNSIDYRKYS